LILLNKIQGEMPPDVTEVEIEQAMAQARTVPLSIEEHQGWLYAWDAENNKFLAQGQTVNQLFERLYELAMGWSGEQSVAFKIIKDQGGDIVKQRLLTEQTEGAIIDDEE
jgi:hypothetical protein